MPPLPSVPNVFKVAFKGVDSGGTNWANVCHFKWSGATPGPSTCQGFADLWVTAWGTVMKPLQSTGTTFESCTVTDLTSPMGASWESVLSTPGTRTGSVIPGHSAFLISYPGAGPRYRGGHPRQYLNVGVQADLLDESHWASAFVTSVSEGWSALTYGQVSEIVDGTELGDQCAVSYYETDYTTTPHTRKRKAVPDVYTITSQEGNAQLASQRGRIGRRRR